MLTVSSQSILLQRDKPARRGIATQHGVQRSSPLHCHPAPLHCHPARAPLLARARSAPPAAAATAGAAAPAAAMGVTWGGALAVGAGAAAVATAGVYLYASRHLDESPGAASPEERHARLEAIADGWIKKSFPEVPEMTAQQLVEAAESPGARLVVVDVRTPEEQATSMIGLPGAQVVTAQQFEAERERWAGHKAVCHCTVGYRSGQFAQKLVQEGGEAFNLRGGILGYTHAGLPLVEPATGAPTKRVHVYAPRWAMHGDGFTPVAFQQPVFAMLKESLSNMFGGRRKQE